MKQKFYTLILLLLGFNLFGQTVISDDDLGSETYNWTADTEYLIDGYVFLESGGVLNIEAGTVIKAKGTPSTGESTSALIIAKGAKINAEGTASQPIIFTAEFDNVEDATDLTSYDKGLWGGLIILGNGVLGVDGESSNIEGIPSTETRGIFGGDDNTESSGILKYVSIRHGGDKLGADDEINGLTLGAVGSGTTIDFIEVYANLDDGIEWFGGAVNVNHAVVSFCGDDSYDYDQSWDGKGQFWFSLQNELSNRAGEWDGSERSDLLPKASPTLANLTFIGAGIESNNDDGNDAIRLRDDGAAKIYNSIITEFADGAIILDNDSGEGLSSDSYDRFLAGETSFNGLVIYGFGDGESIADVISTDGGDDNLFVTHLTDGQSVYGDPEIASISRTNDGNLDPRINASGAAWNSATVIEDEYFEETSYSGAFLYENWAVGWTALSANGYFGNLQSSVNDLNEFVSNKSLKIYPNPASFDFVNIELDLEETKSIALNITDMNGRLVKTVSSKQNYFAGNYLLSVDIAALPNGYYTINVVADKGVFSNKLVISK